MFRTGPYGIPGDAGPRSLAIPGSSSHRLHCPFRVLSHFGPAQHSQVLSSSPGVTLSLSRHQFSESTCRKPFPRLPTFRPQRFSRSRRLAPHQILRVYFTPLPRLRFTLQGISPTASFTGSSPAFAFMTFSSFSYGRVAPTAPDPVVRLQGFAPTVDPSSLTGGLVLPAPRSPLKFSLLRAFLRPP